MSDTQNARSRVRSWTSTSRGKRWLLAAPAMVMTLLGIMWGLSQPLSSAPDEPEHLIRAVSLYSGSGIKVRLKVEGQTFSGRVRVPEYFARGLPNQHCVVDDVLSPATCKSAHTEHPRRIVEDDTSAAGHPPLYYLLVGWIGRLIPSAVGVVLMRIWSVLMCGLLLFVATTVLSRRAKTMYPAIVALTAFSPVAAFIGGSVNPQAFEICLTLAAFALAWDLFSDLTGRPDSPSPPVTKYAAVFAISLALGLTRPLSALFLLAAVVAALLLSHLPPRALTRPKVLLAGGVALIGLPAAVAFELWAGHSSVRLVPAHVPRNFSEAHALLSPIGAWVIQAGGTVSSLEAGASSLAAGGLIVATLVTLLVAAFVGERRASLLAVAAVAGTVALPVVANIPNVVELNVVIWQGRYGLPLLALALVSAGLAVAELREPMERRLRSRGLAIVCWTMAIAHFGGWWFAMYRWSVGIGGPMWWPARAGWTPRLSWWLLAAGMLIACAGYALVFPAAASLFEADHGGRDVGEAADGLGDIDGDATDLRALEQSLSEEAVR